MKNFEDIAMNVMQGKLIDINVDNSITVIEIELDTEKTIVCYAESNLFMSSIEDAYGDEWLNKYIEFELDSSKIMKWFNPIE